MIQASFMCERRGGELFKLMLSKWYEMAGYAVVLVLRVPLGGTPLLWAERRGSAGTAQEAAILSWVQRKRSQNSEAELAFTLRHMHMDIQFPLYIMFFAQSKVQAA